MARDTISSRFEKHQLERKLADLARRARSTEEIEAEKELLKRTPKAEPIKADERPKRNAPCRCGSGLKYKNCCSRKGS
jgi:uncharacterized protein YecA (UPF0149 family)